MQNTRALRRLLPQIHQPLPLTKHESDRLLKSITKSFRDHLDREHGFSEPSPPTPSASSAPSSTSKPQATNHQRHRPTDQHLRALLSNPAFSPPLGKLSADTTMPSSGNPGVRDPMDFFEEAAAKGMMNIKAAVGCMSAKRMAVLRNTVETDYQPALGATRTAERVLAWLRASGLEESLVFLDMRIPVHVSFVHHLLVFMVAERLEPVVWSWLERLVAQDTLSGTIMSRDLFRRFLFSREIRTLDRNPDQAVSPFLSADDRYHASPNFTEIFASSWVRLSGFLATTPWQFSKPSEDVFDSFVACADHLVGVNLDTSRAHLQLRHPTRPSHERAVEVLKANGDAMGGNTKRGRKLELLLADTLDYLMGIGEEKEASWLLSFTNRAGGFQRGLSFT